MKGDIERKATIPAAGIVGWCPTCSAGLCLGPLIDSSLILVVSAA